MENNVKYVKNNEELHDGAKGLVKRSVEMAKSLIAAKLSTDKIPRGGLKAHRPRLPQ
jgi:hypothetical protein